jgi:hypothetical protein
MPARTGAQTLFAGPPLPERRISYMIGQELGSALP